LKYAIINDANEQLINVYKVVADNDLYPEFKDTLLDIQNQYNNDDMKKEKYILFRHQYNHWIKGETDLSNVWGAAAFVFLNKCGFNGLYRINQKGEFNVSWGKCESVKLFNEDELDKAHILLNEKVAILSGDYKRTDVMLQVSKVEKLNIIYYLDPPYKVVNVAPASGSSLYVNDEFDDKEQERLKIFCDEIDHAGGKFLLSNSKYNDYFEELYDGYNIDTVAAKRRINSAASKRGAVKEVLISN
jgi:DNA adenine methylase